METDTADEPLQSQFEGRDFSAIKTSWRGIVVWKTVTYNPSDIIKNEDAKNIILADIEVFKDELGNKIMFEPLMTTSVSSEE